MAETTATVAAGGRCADELAQRAVESVLEAPTSGDSGEAAHAKGGADAGKTAMDAGHSVLSVPSGDQGAQHVDSSDGPPTTSPDSRKRDRVDSGDEARQAPAAKAAAKMTGTAAAILQQALKRQKAKQKQQEQSSDATSLRSAYLQEVSRLASVTGEGGGGQKWFTR